MSLASVIYRKSLEHLLIWRARVVSAAGKQCQFIELSQSSDSHWAYSQLGKLPFFDGSRDCAIMWLIYYFGFVLPVLLQGYLAWKGGVLTPSQMQANGIEKGLPFVAHTAMWSDVSLFAAGMATIVGSYGHHWTFLQCGVAIVVGLVASAGMHWGLYIRDPIEQAHVSRGKLTTAGIVHFVYMAIGIAVVVLFYTSSANPSAAAVVAVSAGLIGHVIIGTLVPLKIWANIARPQWYPEKMAVDAETVLTILGVGAALGIGSIWAMR